MDDVHFSSAQKSELLHGVDGQALFAVRQAGIVRGVKRNWKLLKQGG